MPTKNGQGKRHVARAAKHVITWEQFCAFAAASGRDRTHAFRVFKGERESATLDAEFVAHFGFSMKDTALAGRKRLSA